MAAATEKNQAGQSHTNPPEGFQRSGTAAAVGWFALTNESGQPSIGNTLSGKLAGVYERPDALRKEGSSKFFQVQIDRPCLARAGTGEDAEIVEAKPGDFVNVNYGPKTKPWEQLVSDIKRGAEYAVLAVVVGDKVTLTGGRKMHNLDAFHKMVTPPKVDDVDDASFDEGAPL